MVKDSNDILDTKTKNLGTSINNIETKLTKNVADLTYGLVELDSDIKNEINNKFKQTNEEILKSKTELQKLNDDLSLKLESQQKLISDLIQKDKEIMTEIINRNNSIK